jgi:esterase/lipase superfamily enzyme
LARDGYWGAVGAQLATTDPEERGALIFVHGYNVSFEEAALRAAQIGFDLSVKDAMAFFSWPSQGLTRGYPADEATIDASEGVIADFMTDFAERSGATTVHIIAHSMGNRGVLRAVNRIAAKAERRTGKPFGQVFLPLPMSMPMCSASCPRPMPTSPAARRFTCRSATVRSRRRAGCTTSRGRG